MLHDRRDRAARRQWARAPRGRTEIVPLLGCSERALLETRVDGAAFGDGDAGFPHRQNLDGLPGWGRVRCDVEVLEDVGRGSTTAGAKGDGSSQYTGERGGHH